MADINLGVGGANSAVAGGYEIENSLKFEHSNAESLGKDQAQGTQTTWTFSTWLKRTALSDTSHSYQHVWAAGRSDLDNGTKFYFRGDSSYPENRIFFYMDNGGTQYLHGATSQSFRDTSAWYHIVWAVDTTQSTASDRSKVYINGELQTLVGVPGAAFTNPPQNSSTRVNDNGGVMYVGAANVNGGNRFNGYLAETVLIDGSQLDVTDFGEYDDDTGIWIPKDVSELSFGTRGFYLDYSDASNLGNDADGSTEFNEYNITAADQATDTPTNNFCTLNPLYKCADTTMTDGATNCDRTNNGNNTVRGTFVVTTGKWYWEVAVHRGTVNANYPFMGMTGNFTTEPCSWLYGDSKSFYVSGSGSVEDAGSYKGAGTAAAQDPSHSIYGFAVDIDNEELYWYTNGTVNNSGNAYSISTSVGNSDEGMTPFLFMFTGANQSFNFGGYSVITPSSAASDANGYGTFEYAPPSGYYALCTKNLAEFG